MAEALVDLVAQVVDIHVNHIGVGVEVFVPHVPQQLLTAQHHSVVMYEIFEQPAFFHRKVYHHALTLSPVCRQIQHNIIVSYFGRHAAGIRAASQQCGYACLQLPEAERLYHIVVGSRVEPVDNVLRSAQGGEKQHRGVA